MTTSRGLRLIPSAPIMGSAAGETSPSADTTAKPRRFASSAAALRRPVLRAEGTPLFRSHLSSGRPRPCSTMSPRVRRPPDRAARGRPPRHGDPLQPQAGHALAAHDELVAVSPRTRQGQFDESGRSSPRRRRTATATIPPTTTRGLLGPCRLRPRAPTGRRRGARARDVENTRPCGGVRRRTGGRTMDLMTSDAYPPTRQRSWPPTADGHPAADGQAGPAQDPLHGARRGADVRHGREAAREGRVVEISPAWSSHDGGRRGGSGASRYRADDQQSFVERHNGTDRHHNARNRGRPTVQQGLAIPRGGHLFHDVQLQLLLARADVAASNRGWPLERRTPAMAAGLTDHVWSLSEWIRFPVVLRS